MSEETEPQPRLTMVPLKRSRDARIGLPCKRPTCTSVVEPNPTGRPKEFCTPTCQQTYHRERAGALKQLEVELNVARAYGHRVRLVAADIDPDDPDDPDDPVGSGEPVEPDDSPPPRRPASATAPSLAPRAPNPSPIPERVDLTTRLLHEINLAVAELDAAYLERQPARERLIRARDAAYRELLAGNGHDEH